MTNLILNVCAVVSNTVVATVPMELKPVYERVKVFDDPDCFPCHRPELLVIADCTCKWSVIPTHYVIVQKNDCIRSAVILTADFCNGCFYTVERCKI